MPYLPMLSPVFMRDERNLGRLAHEKLMFFVKLEISDFSDEKVKAMLLALKVMLLHAEVMPLQMGT